MSLHTVIGTISVLLLTGLVGSLGHCLGMCGPLVILAGAGYPKRGVGSSPYHLLYHSGRVTMYTLMGIGSGLIGDAFKKLAVAADIPGIVSLLIGLFVIVMGLSYMGVLPFWKRSVEGNGWWQRLMKSVQHAPVIRRALILGVLNGVLPCGLVYEALLIAGASGSPWVGGLGMLVFGLATIPTLTVLGVLSGAVTYRFRRWLVYTGGVFVIIVGVFLVLRGLSGLGLGFSQFS